MNTAAHTQTEARVVAPTDPESGSKARRVACSCGWAKVIEHPEVRCGETFVIAQAAYARHAAGWAA
jgi:hypothetical protein